MSENFEQQLGDLMPEKTQEELEVEKRVEEKKVIDRVIRGVNDTFVKKYKYDDIGLDCTIKIKAPNALEQGKIQARVAVYLGGMGMYMDNYTVTAYTTMATIHETGIDVPKELADAENIYNMDIFYRIGVDFKQWLDNFRI